MPPLRDRVPLLRELVLRLAALPDDLVRDDLAGPPERALLLFAADERLDPEPDDLAAVDVDLFARPALARDPLDLLDDARELLLRPPLERDEPDFAPLCAPPDDDAEPDPELALASTSRLLLTDITLCAASATA